MQRVRALEVDLATGECCDTRDRSDGRTGQAAHAARDVERNDGRVVTRDDIAARVFHLDDRLSREGGAADGTGRLRRERILRS